MNKKLIAVAVASVVAAPAAYADISAYGRINNKIVFAENADGENTQDMSTSGSRFGFKGSGDIGNGMSAFARYEFSTTTNDAGGGSGIGRRLAFVGLSGSFGSVSLGQQWSAYFKNFGTHASLNWHNGPGQLTVGRAGNTIQYANQFGPVSLTLDARVDDSDVGGMDRNESRGWSSYNGNGFGGGVTITPMDNVTIAAAIDSSDGDAMAMIPDRDVMGAAAIVGLGGFTVTVAHEQLEVGDNMDTSNTLLWLGSNVTDQLNLKVGYGLAKTEQTGMPDSETDQLAILGVYNLGGGLKLWSQFHNATTKGPSNSDDDEIVLGVRMDF